MLYNIITKNMNIKYPITMIFRSKKDKIMVHTYSGYMFNKIKENKKSKMNIYDFIANH